MKPKRFDKNSWIMLGLTNLSQHEHVDITIDQLCESAGKTKGSFYFHFTTIDEYLEALAHFWLNQYTAKIISRQTSNSARLDLLNQLAARLDLNLETSIRKLALRNSTVQKIVTQADQLRIKWLAELYTNSGNYSQSEAINLASIEIAAFTGFRLINPDMKPGDAKNLYESFLKLTNRT